MKEGMENYPANDMVIGNLAAEVVVLGNRREEEGRSREEGGGRKEEGGELSENL